MQDKLLSLFEPSTEVIRHGKASKPTEFGKVVKLQEAEHQIITAYVVYDKRPSDSDLLIPALDAQAQTLGRVPRLVAGDAAFYSSANEAAAHLKGVTRVCIPNRSTKSAERKHGGSRTGRSGGPGVRVASASSSGGTDSIAVATKAPTG